MRSCHVRQGGEASPPPCEHHVSSDGAGLLASVCEGSGVLRGSLVYFTTDMEQRIAEAILRGDAEQPSSARTPRRPRASPGYSVESHHNSLEGRAAGAASPRAAAGPTADRGAAPSSAARAAARS
ncbi:unnamed protein product, partial [Prorocentrum cordatum]